MGFLGNLIAEKRSEIDLSNLRTPKEWLMAAGGGVLTKAGTTVNERTAMSLSAVYSSVKIISWVMASLPLHVYSPSGRGKNRASNEPVYKLLHDAPNTEQTSFQWRSFMYAMQNLWGAGVSEIEYDSSFNPIALWPIPTWCITPKRTYGTKQLYYEILDPLTGEMRQLSPWQLIIFPALSASLDNWLSPIAQHRETIGAAMAAKEFGALTFGQGVNPAGILSGLKFPDEAGEATFVKKMNENYAGLSQSHRLMMLEEGIKFDRIGLPPEDAQYLETRRFDVAEIARIYNIPLFLLQEMSGTTSWGSGIEEMNLGFVSYTLRPYAVLSEQEFKMKLFGETELFAEYLFDGLLRGKLSERYAAHAVGRQWGWLSANDILEIENRNPIGAQGDIYLDPMNMVNAKYFEKIPPPPSATPAEKPVKKETVAQGA